jgi:ABC-2 type transport system ATP-binding protein
MKATSRNFTTFFAADRTAKMTDEHEPSDYQKELHASRLDGAGSKLADRMPQVLEVTSLRKSFGDVQALCGISFSIAPGEIFGYLGPNGAGKTTTLRILTDLIHADAGEARLFGLSCRDARSRQTIGYLPGELKLYGSMSGRQLLDLFAGFRPDRPPVMRKALLDALELSEDLLERKIKFLSHGTKQKVGIVVAMQHDPRLLLLDEPTSGLDPLVQEAFRRQIVEFAARGGAVVFSSHVLSEVQAICGRVAILRAGQIVAMETVEKLRAAMVRRLRVRFRSTVPPDLEKTPGVVRATLHRNEAELFLRGDINAVIRRLASAELEDIVFPEPELEDIFLSYYRDNGND